MTNRTSAEIVGDFFAAFGSGNIEALVALFDKAAEIVAVRHGPPQGGEPYGAYRGQQGARDFVVSLGATFDTRAFAVESIVGEGEVAFASGTFTHEVKRTGRLFQSDWALRCVVRDGRIVKYSFFEDSAAFVRAAA